MNKDILKNREKIDSIDNQIFELLMERMNAVNTIRNIKKEKSQQI